MKTITIYLFLLFGVNCFAQTDIEIVPASKGFSVSSYIYSDGSFDIYCGDMVYPYNAKGDAKGAPYEFRDDVKSGASAEFSIPGSLLTDVTKDVRYAFEPVTSNNIAQAKRNPGVIIVDKLGTKNQDRKIIKFESDIAIKSNEANESRDNLYAYLDEDRNPVFVRVQTGISKRDPSNGQKLNKDKHNMFIERIQLDTKTETIKVTSHLMNKSPIDRGKNSSAGMYFVGVMNGKLFVCLDYQENFRASIGKVDVWSIDEKTGEEKLEYSYTYDIGDIPHWSRGRITVYSDPSTSGLFFHHAYSVFTPLKERNKKYSEYPYSPSYVVLQITPSLEFSVSKIELPHSLVSHNDYPPNMGVYNYDSKTCFFIRSADGKTLVITKEGEDGQMTTQIIDAAYKNMNGYQIFFDQNMEDWNELIQSSLFKPDEKCGHCRISSNVCWRVDENDVKRLVYCNDMENCDLNCSVSTIRVRVESEEKK